MRLLLLLSTKAYRHQNDIEGEKLGWFLSSDCVRLTERRLEIKHFNRGEEEETAHTPTITLLLILCAKIMSIWRVRIFFFYWIMWWSIKARAYRAHISEAYWSRFGWSWYRRLFIHTHSLSSSPAEDEMNFFFCTFAHCQCGIEYMVWHRILISVKERWCRLCVCVVWHNFDSKTGFVFAWDLQFCKQARPKLLYLYLPISIGKKRPHRWYSPVSFLDFRVQFKISFELSEKSQQISAIWQE